MGNELQIVFDHDQQADLFRRLFADGIEAVEDHRHFRLFHRAIKLKRRINSASAAIPIWLRDDDELTAMTEVVKLGTRRGDKQIGNVDGALDATTNRLLPNLIPLRGKRQ